MCVGRADAGGTLAGSTGAGGDRGGPCMRVRGGIGVGRRGGLG